jgi:hypothetical protein
MYTIDQDIQVLDNGLWRSAKVLSNPDTNTCYVHYINFTKKYDANVEKELIRDPIPRVEYSRKELTCCWTNLSTLILNDSITFKNVAYVNETKATVMINDPFLLVITCQLEDESLLDLSYKDIIKQKQQLTTFNKSYH